MVKNILKSNLNDDRLIEQKQKAFIFVLKCRQYSIPYDKKMLKKCK